MERSPYSPPAAQIVDRTVSAPTRWARATWISFFGSVISGLVVVDAWAVLVPTIDSQCIWRHEGYLLEDERQGEPQISSCRDVRGIYPRSKDCEKWTPTIR